MGVFSKGKRVEIPARWYHILLLALGMAIAYLSLIGVAILASGN